MSCKNCNCAECAEIKRNIDILFVAEINEKYKLDISCCYNEDDIEKIRNISATNQEEFLIQLLANFHIPFIQMCYSNARISDDVAGFLQMCNKDNINEFFECLTTDCNLTDENEQYLKIFANFIKTYYNISDNMFNMFFTLTETHTITFTEKNFIIECQRVTLYP